MVGMGYHGEPSAWSADGDVFDTARPVYLG